MNRPATFPTVTIRRPLSRSETRTLWSALVSFRDWSRRRATHGDLSADDMARESARVADLGTLLHLLSNAPGPIPEPISDPHRSGAARPTARAPQATPRPTAKGPRPVTRQQQQQQLHPAPTIPDGDGDDWERWFTQHKATAGTAG